MKRLWQRLHRDPPGCSHEEIALALDTTRQKALERLAFEGRLRTRHDVQQLALPSLYQEVLEVALDAHRRPELLRMHFLDVMPTMLIEQVAVCAEDDVDFFHRDLEWDRLPRLVKAIRSFERLLEDHCISGDVAWAWQSIEELKTTVSSLGEWMHTLCFGTSFPLLYGYPNDLLSYADEVRETDDFWAVFDRRFTNPLIHELSHFGRCRPALFPPLLDESLSAYIGFLAHPQIAFPDLGQDNGLMGAAFFSQIGQAFVRNFGLRESLRAHVGVTSFESLLGKDALHHVERLGWFQMMQSEDVSLLAGHDNPSLWQKVFYLLGAGKSLDGMELRDIEHMPFGGIEVGKIEPMDRDIVRDAITSMCLRNRLNDASYRVERSLPEQPIRIDLEACSVTRENASDDAGHCDPVYLFPPHLAASLRREGLTKFVLQIFDWPGIDEAASALFEGRVDDASDLYELRVVEPHA